MTRINIVPTKLLTDQHLVAEYREITMVAASLRRSLRITDELSIPHRYCLGKGHISFFYDKGQYLNIRYDLLVNEMLKRGMNPNADRTFPLSAFPLHLRGDWRPDIHDVVVIQSRISEKIAQKPHWYRYKGASLITGSRAATAYRVLWQQFLLEL